MAWRLPVSFASPLGRSGSTTVWLEALETGTRRAGPPLQSRKPTQEGTKGLAFRTAGILGHMEPRRSGYRRHLASSPFPPPEQPPPLEEFTVGERVSHDRYGLGRVVLLEGVAAVVVDFGDGRVRIRAPFNKLTKL